MKTRNSLLAGILFLSGLAAARTACAQADSTKPELSVNLHYFDQDNAWQYLVPDIKVKVNGRFQPLAGQPVEIYLDSVQEGDRIASLVTGDHGTAKAVIPPSLKAVWDASPAHTFWVVLHKAPGGQESSNDFAISRARISIDTARNDGTRSVTATILQWAGGSWKPAKGVDVKVGIRRLGGELPVGDEESYTTDSTGRISADFKRDSLPGDSRGNLVLVARVEDNDQFGNLVIEKTVPWGIRFQPHSDFGRRTLWATRNHTPIWLLVMAYSIIAAVWGVIFYLITRLVRIRRLGREVPLPRGS
ncbi:MAG TPA: hypothetical protein VG870_12490 [Chitinophagaceae bacterium]|nr:hypothetical protein [Chitinophagaceae bacterium]